MSSNTPHGMTISEDESLLNWQGVNYVRQDPAQPKGWDPLAVAKGINGPVTVYPDGRITPAEATLADG